jgi:hypothetical protein
MALCQLLGKPASLLRWFTDQMEVVEASMGGHMRFVVLTAVRTLHTS